MTHQSVDQILVLDVEGTGATRRRLWLRPGQAIHIGRTQRADESFPDDVGMSSRHFRVEPTHEGWLCRDLGSTNGTYLNDTRIAHAIVHPGDRIRAGNTTFLVVSPYAPDPDKEGHAELSKAPAAPNLKPRQVVRPPRNGELNYRRFDTQAELALFVGQSSCFDPSMIVRAIVQKDTALLVCDERQAESFSASEIRIPLLDSEFRTTATPWRTILSLSSLGEIDKAFKAGWGRDEFVVFAAGEKPDQAIQSIRSLAREAATHQRNWPVAGMRPAALAEFITNRPAQEVRSLFLTVRCVFLEIFKGDRWGILAPRDRELALQDAGFAAVPSWE